MMFGELYFVAGSNPVKQKVIIYFLPQLEDGLLARICLNEWAPMLSLISMIFLVEIDYGVIYKKHIIHKFENEL